MGCRRKKLIHMTAAVVSKNTHGATKRLNDSEIVIVRSVGRSVERAGDVTFVVRLGVPGNGSRRNDGEFLRNRTHNDCKVFSEASLAWPPLRQFRSFCARRLRSISVGAKIPRAERSLEA